MIFHATTVKAVWWRV